MRSTVLFSLASVLAVAGTAAAQPKPTRPPRACGASILPLSVGNEWTYNYAALPPDRQLSEAQQKALPPPVKQVTVKVTAIDTKDGVTTVTLAEDHDGRAHQTWLTCNGAGMTMAPDAFWFNGEPGPAIGIELTDLERKGRTLSLLAGKINPDATDWHDDLSAKWKHIAIGKVFPVLRMGTVELVRHVVPQPSETVKTNAGTWKAAKLGIETTFKITIQPATEQPLREIPLLVNLIYLADEVGVVQVVNSRAQYFLTNYNAQ